MNSITGQYEYVHHSGMGLEYFTARLDRLTIYANGRFTLLEQEKSRALHAAKSLVSGQQANMDVPDIRNEGSYSIQNNTVILAFDSGERKEGEILETGLQFGQYFYEKVSDSTVLPPAQRLKSNMEDIAKGLKIAGTIGGTVIKAAKGLQDTFQPNQSAQNQASTSTSPATTPAQPQQSWQTTPAASPSAPQSAPTWQAQSVPPTSANEQTQYCDQCGSPVRPGKKFCNKCGARLV
jgi:zinc-ribbon domain